MTTTTDNVANIAFEPNLTHVAPDSIILDEQAIDLDNVAQLTNSMKRDGFVGSILLRRGDDGRLYIVAGRHRVQAAKAARLKAVAARVVRAGTPLARIEALAIEENLCRRVLSDSERAVEVAKLDGLLSAGGMASRVERDKAVARKSGLGLTTVRAMRRRDTKLGRALISALAGTSLSSGIEQDALCKITGAQRDTLVAQAIAGETVSAIEVLARQKAQRRPQAELDGEAIVAAWEQSGPGGRTHFENYLRSRIEVAATIEAARPYRDALSALPTDPRDAATDAWLRDHAADDAGATGPTFGDALDVEDIARLSLAA